MTANDSYDEGLRRRLVYLAERHAQADIARKTNTSKSNVSRYLQGRKIPASFCAALIDAFELNPTWLMKGEGTPYLYDVRAEAGTSASNLLELVQSMNSVASMRLGSLVGKDYAKILNQLNDALQRHEVLSEKLEKQVRPFLVQVVDDLAKALAQSEYNQALGLKEAAYQLARVCRLPDVEQRLEHLASAVDVHFGKRDDAVSHAQRALLLALADGVLDDDVALSVQRHTQMLRSFGMLAEARGICEAALALTRYGETPASIRATLEFELGYLLSLDGRLKRGMTLVQTAFTRLPGDRKTLAFGAVVETQFLAGALGVSESFHLPVDDQGFFPLTFLKYACWNENPDELAEALKFAARARRSNELKSTFVAYVELLIAALRGDKTVCIRYVQSIKRAPADRLSKWTILSSFVEETRIATLARVSENEPILCETRHRGSNLLEQMKEHGVRPNVLQRAMYERNAMSGSGNSRFTRRANTFFRRIWARGYGGLIVSK